MRLKNWLVSALSTLYVMSFVTNVAAQNVISATYQKWNEPYYIQVDQNAVWFPSYKWIYRLDKTQKSWSKVVFPAIPGIQNNHCYHVEERGDDIWTVWSDHAVRFRKECFGASQENG